ncbi:hypothetical protein BKA70DRAFT_1525355 [Coprinopsis sp. MPI-PUGE-AT-0042]|nr:hypothetical protein BKA70DRAFT_1525355 [Coprinopsis sp. MPI-PUGE-AT-0042]
MHDAGGFQLSERLSDDIAASSCSIPTNIGKSLQMPRKKAQVPKKKCYTNNLKRRTVYQHRVLEKDTTKIAIDLDIPLRVAQRVLATWDRTGEVSSAGKGGRLRLLGPQEDWECLRWREGVRGWQSRVGVVEYRGAVLYDRFVAPTLAVTDCQWRMAVTGIAAGHLQPPNTWSLSVVQQEITNLMKGKVLVGRSFWDDLSVLGIPRPALATRGE